MGKLVKTNYGRNMWRIMKEFNVLPTDPRFQALTTNQLDYIINSMVQDSIEIEKASKGVNSEVTASDDNFDLDTDMNLPQGEDEEDLINQVEEQLRKDEEQLTHLRDTVGLSEEQVQKLEALGTYRERVAEMYELARELEKSNMTMEEYKMNGGVIPDRPDTESEEEEKIDLDEVIKEFNDDDDFYDLT